MNTLELEKIAYTYTIFNFESAKGIWTTIV